MSRGVLIGLLIGAASVNLFAQTITSTASVSGTLVGDDGNVLAGSVTVHRTTPPLAGGSALASTSGAFTLTGLPAGTYVFCAVVAGNGYMDPCAWSAEPVALQLGAGQAITGYRLIVKKGVAVQVRLNDPGSVLGATAQPNQTAPHVLLGFITTRGIFQPMFQTSKDAAGQNLQGFIPANASVPLYVGSKGVQVADSTGKALDPNSTSITVGQPSSTGAQPTGTAGQPSGTAGQPSGASVLSVTLTVTP